MGPADTLDHASRIQDYGSKMGIDATRKWESEGFRRPWPDEIVMDSATKKRIDSIWQSLGLKRSTKPPKKVSGKPILVIVVLVFTEPNQLCFLPFSCPRGQPPKRYSSEQLANPIA